MLRLGDYHTVEQDDFERSLIPERIVIHKKYHSQGWEYDIALLRLKGGGGGLRGVQPAHGARVSAGAEPQVAQQEALGLRHHRLGHHRYAKFCFLGWRRRALP